MRLLDGRPRPLRDGSSFMIFKRDTATGKELIEGSRTVVGSAKAETILKGLRAQLRQEDPMSRYTWAIRLCSPVGRDRLAFGFRRS
jgi:hypothetical protein